MSSDPKISVDPLAETGLSDGDSFESELAAVLAPAAEAVVHTGQIVAERYEILGSLGRGGMGAVYRARHLKTEGDVALKVLRKTTEASTRRFEVEARNAAALNHPNTVRVFDYGVDGELHYLVMERVEGVSLRALVARGGPLGWDRVEAMARQILAALAAAHEHPQGIIHRDIKPSNIVVNEGLGDHVTVVDFGVSRALLGDGAATMGVIGTPAYLAPEAWQGAPCDARTDLYALGCTLFELLTGRSPFKAEFPGALGYEHVHGTAPELIQVAPGVPEWAGGWVAWLMAKRPSKRPPTARAAYDALIRGSTLSSSSASGPVSVVPSSRVDSAPVIPAPDTAFIGREAELDSLVSLLDTAHLVTLLGPGGAGKTRLAQELGRRTLGSWRGGVYFCDLVQAHDTREICDVVSRQLGLVLGGDPARQLGAVLAARGPTLLLLDNFEQVVHEATATIGRWLTAAPHAKFVVTSRERLQLDGEQVVTLGPLGLPSDSQLSLESVSEADAVKLLVDRIHASGAQFELTAENVADAAGLVRALDGLPLAIELAARRARMLPLRGILARLEQRFKLLRSRARGLEPRQLTMWGAIAWSWDLLEAWERSALAQCAVFRGGFTLEAAEAVIDLDAWPDAPWVVDVVDSLLDKSCLFLQPAQPANDEPRFDMYVSIREFAQEQWADLGLGHSLRRRHAEYFAGFTPPPPVLVPYAGFATVMRIEGESSNVFAGLSFVMQALREPSRQAGDGLPRCGAHLSLLATALFLHRGPVGVEAIVALVDNHLAELDIDLALELFLARGYLGATQGGLEANLQWGQRALDEARRVGNRVVAVRALRNLSVAAGYVDDVDRAVATIDEALALVAHLDDPFLQALVKRQAAHARSFLGRVVEARALLAEAREQLQPFDEPVIETYVTVESAMLANDDGELDAAERAIDRALELQATLPLPYHRGVILMELSRLRVRQGRYDEAHKSGLRALQIAEELDNSFQRRWAQNAIAEVLVHEGRFDEALALALRVEESAAAMGEWPAHLRASILSTRARVGLERIDEARDRLSAAAEIGAQSARARLEVAMARAELDFDIAEPGDLELLPDSGRLVEGRRARARGLLARRVGDLRAARSYLDDSQRVLGDTACLVELTTTLVERARLELADGQIDAARAFLGRIQGISAVAPESLVGRKLEMVWKALARKERG